MGLFHLFSGPASEDGASDHVVKARDLRNHSFLEHYEQ